MKHAECPRTQHLAYFFLLAYCYWLPLYGFHWHERRTKTQKPCSQNKTCYFGKNFFECQCLDLSCWALERKHSQQTFCTIKVHAVLISSVISHWLTQGFINVSSQVPSLEMFLCILTSVWCWIFNSSSSFWFILGYIVVQWGIYLWYGDSNVNEIKG